MSEVELPSGLLWAIRYLSSVLSVPVRGEVPSPRPAEFVRVLGAGGNDRAAFGDEFFTVESWSTTTLKAEALARLVHRKLKAGHGVTVSGVRCASFTALGLPYDEPDPDAGVPRFRQSVSLTFSKQGVSA